MLIKRAQLGKRCLALCVDLADPLRSVAAGGSQLLLELGHPRLERAARAFLGSLPAERLELVAERCVLFSGAAERRLQLFPACSVVAGLKLELQL